MISKTIRLLAAAQMAVFSLPSGAAAVECQDPDTYVCDEVDDCYLTGSDPWIANIDYYYCDEYELPEYIDTVHQPFYNYPASFEPACELALSECQGIIG